MLENETAQLANVTTELVKNDAADELEGLTNGTALLLNTTTAMVMNVTASLNDANPAMVKSGDDNGETLSKGTAIVENVTTAMLENKNGVCFFRTTPLPWISTVCCSSFLPRSLS